MLKRLLTTTLTAALLTAAFAGNSSASVTIGSTCAADAQYNALVLNASHVARSDGVITMWGINVTSDPAAPSPGRRSLLLLDPAGFGSWKIAAKTNSELIQSGRGVKAHLPVRAGQVISSTGSGFTCESTSRDAEIADPVAPSVAVGTVISTEFVVGETAALWAAVEPDSDRDGFGDETQDLCPQSALFQTYCPVPAVIPKVSYTKNQIILDFTPKVETRLSVSGSVKVDGRRLKMSKKASVPAGTTSRLTLKYPTKLRKALAKLSKKKSIKLKLTIKGEALGQSRTRNRMLTLKGQKQR